jgi:dynein heavy chain 2
MRPHRCESNPALYTRCSLLWLGEWRRASMKLLPGMLLGAMLEELGAEDLVERMIGIHDSCKPRGATPRDFVSFLDAYRTLYNARVGNVGKDMKHLEAGLTKLQQAATTVDDLSRDANTQRGQLKEKQLAADQAMENITKTLETAADRRKEVEELKAKAMKAEGEAGAQRKVITDELGEIQPILDKAKEAVGQIKKANLDEIRALNAPPEPIADVIGAVLVLLKVSDLTWSSMRRFLGNRCAYAACCYRQ